MIKLLTYLSLNYKVYIIWDNGFWRLSSSTRQKLYYLALKSIQNKA